MNAPHYKILLLIAIVLITTPSIAQNKPRPLSELINTAEPGWTLVNEWIKEGKNRVEVLPVDTFKARTALYELQVTTRSPLGAIVYGTGGIMIDHGWIRILGAGNSRLLRTLPGWNRGKILRSDAGVPEFLLIADDAIGGFFILNGNSFGKDPGKIYYLSPDNLKYEPLDMSYSQFLQFCFSTNLDEFYKGSRWPNWQAEVAALKGDEVFAFFPYLWTKEGRDISKDDKKRFLLKSNIS